MQYIRKLQSSVNKIAYPSGVSQVLGTLALEPIAKIPDISSLGYNDNSIFQNDGGNPAKWNFARGTYISKTTLKDGKVFGKMVAVQKRFSNDGTIFPPSVNAYLGTVFYNNTTGEKTIQHKLNIIRNATTYSPVQEIALFQAIVVPNRQDFTPDLGIRVDKDIATPEGLEAVYIKPTMTDINAWNANIQGGSNLTAMALDEQGKQFNAIWQYGQNLVETPEWIQTSFVSPGNGMTYLNSFREPTKSYYHRFSRQFILIDLYDIERWKTKLKSIRITGSSVSTEGGYILPVSQEIIDMCLRAKAKDYDKVALVLVTMTGQLYDQGTSPITKREYTEGAMYRNDIIEDSIDVDPNGNWIRFNLVRPGKYTVWFDNEVYAFEKMSYDATVTINKTNKLFTAGGLLEISLVTQGDSNSSGRLEFIIPDTIPPTAPTIISYATDAVYGTAMDGDKVVVERNNIIIGQGTATSTNTYEVNIPANDLANDQIIFVYTQDTAGNKSAKVEGLVTDIISSLKFDISDSINAIRIGP